MSGATGKQLVFKQYGDRTVVTKYPDMSKAKPSEQQQNRRKLFAEAVAYAQAINRNLEQKTMYKKKVTKGRSI